MYVQSVDGNFYQNPRFFTDKAIVEFGDDGVYLFRKGKISWRTAVKELTELGIRARNQLAGDDGGLSSKIIDGVLVDCTVFGLKLISPIPIPNGYPAFKQAVGDQEILIFKIKKRKP
jgi:hypothetical protein